MKKSLKITVIGKVQGVGYREFVQSNARRLGIIGTVQNTLDGNVSILATGQADKLEDLLDALYQGTPTSVVKEVVAEGVGAEKDFREVFRVIGEAE